MNRKTADPSSFARNLIGSSLIASSVLTGSARASLTDEEDLLLPPRRLEATREGDNWDIRPPIARLAPDRELLDVGAGARGDEPRRDPRDIAEALAALTAELTRMREARESELRELRELRERVQALEAERREDRAFDHTGEEAPVNPFARWIEEHIDELRQYPSTWMAVDPDRGIVFHSQDGESFDQKLEALSDEERSRIIAFHTSMYT